jgi:23S rRNA pseudouridine1911/1915/1917 synthase
VRCDSGGDPVAPGGYARRLVPGERFTVTFDPQQRYQPRPKERPGRGYKVLFRDDDLVVVDKAPDLLTVPTSLRDEESLVDRLLDAERGRGVRRAALYPVHRLDRDTSGLLLFARRKPAQEGLKTQFSEHTIERRYLAIVEGRVDPDQGRFESRLVEDPRSLKVRSTRNPGEGKAAITEYRVTERLSQATVVSVRLLTGRKNQIRAHFSEAGHPLLGDRRYGRASEAIRRTALHAMRLTFTHPGTGERMAFQSPLPPDFRALLRRLRGPAGA